MLKGLNFSCCDIWLMLPRNNLFAASCLLRAGENCIVEAANTPQQFASGMHVPDFSPRKGAMATQMFWRAHDKLSRGPQQSILTHLRTYIIFWYADTHTHIYENVLVCSGNIGSISFVRLWHSRVPSRPIGSTVHCRCVPWEAPWNRPMRWELCGGTSNIYIYIYIDKYIHI